MKKADRASGRSGVVQTPRHLGMKVFVAFLVIGCVFTGILLRIPSRDLAKECAEKCNPRFSRVVPDPRHPPPALGKPPFLVCECY